MWRKALHAVICWLTLSQTSGDAVKTVLSSLIDNVSAESAPRLYRNVPVGVYASAAPYAAYSFHIPFVTAPKPAASRIVPVINNANGYLRDSYGNRFVETPQTAAYKTAFPQQFLPLQELPAHLAQPLVAAASQAKQTAPHYFVGSQYRVPTFQVAPHPQQHPVQGFTGFSQPVVYAQNIRNLAPSGVPAHTQAITAQQQPSSNKAAYTNSQPVQQYNREVKFQRLEQLPAGNQAHSSNNEAHRNNIGVHQQVHEDKGQIQAAPATITAVVNGKKTVVNIETKPPVPLLDLSLLEPLTFANPLVPQVQHFLPRINSATYHKLPEFNANEAKKQKKEYAITKTKSYDSGNVKAKAPPKKKAKQPKVQLDDSDLQKPRAAKPTVTIKGTPELDESPEISYEINSPNYKETYKEKSISYNNAKGSEPVTYNYEEKTQSEPITYSYSKTEQKKPVSYNIVTSKTPDQVEHVITYQGKQQQPEQLIYTFKPEEQNREQNDHQAESEDVGSAEDTSDESNDDGSSHSQRHSNVENHHRPQNQAHQQIHHHPESHHQQPQNHYYSQGHSHHQSYPHPQSHNSEEYHGKPHSHIQRPSNDYHHSHSRHENDQIKHEEIPHKSSEEVQHRSNGNEKHDVHYRPREEIRHHTNNNGYHIHDTQVPHKQSYGPPHHSEEIKVPVNVETQYPVTQQYEEDIKLVPSEAPASNLEENSNENQKEEDSYLRFYPAPLSTLEHYQKLIEEQKRSHAKAVSPQVYSSAAPIIHEQAKRIIIQEESPDEMRVHQEQNIMAEMIEDDGHNEEDFEKAYKNAAYGFQAFEGKSNNREKDVYNPASYGFSRDTDDFDVEKTPFQEYQAEGDSFPKTARANYKDARDNNKEDYYAEYSVNQPERMADFYQNKANYYKLYKNQTPAKYFANDNYGKKKENKSGKYTVAPSFDFNPTPETKQNYFAQYKAEPVKYEYPFAKETPRDRDSSAHASRPYQRYKSKTNFVEPQFQYGFEPIAIPRLLDSELAAMASNDSPESEKPGMRKKIYKENWYIKKTSTSSKPS